MQGKSDTKYWKHSEGYAGNGSSKDRKAAQPKIRKKMRKADRKEVEMGCPCTGSCCQDPKPAPWPHDCWEHGDTCSCEA
jgi:hypothetical protein